MDKAKPLYIVGVGRSGTSLLQSILGTHSSIKGLPETGILRRYIFRKNIKWSALASDKSVARNESLAKKVILADKNRASLMKVYRDSLFEGVADNFVLEKDPRLVEYLDLLSFVEKENRIIVITRDPRDVLVSKKEAAWSRGRTLFSYLTASHVQLTDSRYAKQQSNVFHLSYESLLKNPIAVIESVCQFLCLDFEPNMLNYQETAKTLVHDDEASWKKETFKPLMRSNYGKWSGKLSDIEAYLSVEVANDAFPELNFEQQSKLSKMEKVLAWALYYSVKLASISFRLVRKMIHKKIAREL